MKRLNVKKILANPKLRAELIRRAVESAKVIRKWDDRREVVDGPGET